MGMSRLVGVVPVVPARPADAVREEDSAVERVGI